MRVRTTYAPALVAALVLVACGSGASYTVVAPPTSGPAPTTPAAAFGTETRTETFVDATRSTQPGGGLPAMPSRTLVTTILAPTGSGGPFPLIVFAHGLTATPATFSKLLQAWAAAGYVVAAPAFPLTSAAPQGGVVGQDVVNQPADMSFVITSMLGLSADPASPLYGLVDGRHIGVAGHSLGALTAIGVALDSCCRDGRISAAEILSGAVPNFPGVYPSSAAMPVLFVHGTRDTNIPYLKGTSAYDAAHSPKFLVTLVGSDHTSAFLGPDSQPDVRIVTNVTLDFFEKYLRGTDDALARLQRDANVPFVAKFEAG